MAATVFKGQYYFKTAIGYYIYNYFEGDENTYVFPVGSTIEMSTCSAQSNRVRYNISFPVNLTKYAVKINKVETPDTLFSRLVDNASNNYINLEGANPISVDGCGAFFLRKDSSGRYWYEPTFFRPNNPDYRYVVTNPTSSTFGYATVYFNRPTRMNVGSTQLPSYFTEIFSGSKPFKPTTDPYAAGDITDKDGGNGDFDATSDPVDIPPLPTISATDTGFLTLFNPSLSNIRDLAAYMWANPLFDVNAYKKILANPMDAILGLSIVPCAIPATSSKNVTVGNIPTGVSMPVCDSQYLSIDCGSINVNEYWGAYLDYSPYTKAELYLPYCGIHPIDIDDIMGKAVKVVYHVDILTGACVAYVKCGDSVLYSYIGQCASSIPVSGSDWTNMINGIINASTAIGSMAATGGLTAPMAASTIATTAVNTIKPSIERSGSLSGTGGIMGNQIPYLILTRPRQALPELQNQFSGYPSFISSYLGDLVGYTEVDSVHLEGIPATGAELDEIESILKGGVIL